MSMNAPIVEVFMTAAPHTIGRDQPLTVAKDMMAHHGVRHLPVLDGGQLVGVVSERDVAFIGSVRDVDATQLTVGEAMSPEVYSVSPRELVRNAASNMARYRYGSAVVIDGNRVVGMFTTVDALRALQAVLDASSV
jgi:acetoin utilization protein AcuB